MYDPVKDGVAKTFESVIYTEASPPEALRELVHCYWGASDRDRAR